MKPNYENWTAMELLQGYGNILEELRRRNIIRTLNAPIGDFTEGLVSEALKLTLVHSSSAGYDAYEEVDGQRIKYQIKGRRPSAANRSWQLSAIRNLDAPEPKFDFLIAVIFEPDFAVNLVAKIPHKIISDYAPYVAHTNSFRLNLSGGILNDNRVQILTEQFRHRR